MLILIGGVTATPDPTALPGSNVLQQIVNGTEAWALAICLLGAFIGAAMWAVASHTHSHQYTAKGRMAGRIGRRGARDRSGARPGQLLRAPGDDGAMRARDVTRADISRSRAYTQPPDVMWTGSGTSPATASTANRCSARPTPSSRPSAHRHFRSRIPRRSRPRLARECRTGCGRHVGSAVRAALAQTAEVIGRTTAPELSGAWFSSEYWRVAGLAAMLTLPFLFAAAVRAVSAPTSPSSHGRRSSTSRSRCSESASPLR